MADTFDSRYPPLATHSRANPSHSQSDSYNSTTSQSSLPLFPPRSSSQIPSQLSHPQLNQQLPELSQMSIKHARKPSLSPLDTQTSRSRAYSTKSSTSVSSVKRKPLPQTAAPTIPQQPPTVHQSISLDSTLEPWRPRSYSKDSPLLHDNAAYLSELSNRTGYPHNTSIDIGIRASEDRAESSDEQIDHLQHNRQSYLNDDILTHNFIRNQTPLSIDYGHDERLFSESNVSASSHSASTSICEVDACDSRPIMSTNAVNTTKSLPLALDLSPRIDHDHSGNVNKALPKSPSPTLPRGSKLGSFFNWRADRSSLSPVSPNTENTNDKSHLSVSSIPSNCDSHLSQNSDRRITNATDSSTATNAHNSYHGSVTPSKLDSAVHLEEMEDELRAISSELAISIRREMELEDLVERMQSEAMQGSRRGSDYFSDSGTSSFKYGATSEGRTEEQERFYRRAEREKAQLRLDLTDRVNEERSRRKVLETQIQHLEDRAIRAEQKTSDTEESSNRLKDLESTCEDLRRRLSEERQIKENFEDLLTALKGDLHNSYNERDNLREEIVPQLRAQIEGLEAQAAEREQQSYENAKLQQELQSLRDENKTLVNARNVQADMQQQMSRFNTILEKDSPPQAGSIMKMSRSATVSGRGRDRSAGSSMNRSTSVKGMVESRDELAERVKDVEAQRDALHQALKSLLERQELQDRIHKAKVKQLEAERDRSISTAPRRYDREVENLRSEIHALRRRADEALEQKWQCEKGLGGLKMDLEHAEEEIASLKKLLDESSPKHDGRLLRSNSVVSHSLERAYEELCQARDENLVHAQPNEVFSEAVSTIDNIVDERDVLQAEVDTLRSTKASLHESEKAHLATEQALGNDLQASASRVEELAKQVQGQLALNASLRQRLIDTIERGEQEQKSNAARVTFMQEKLQRLERVLVEAQQNSEDRLAKHENEIALLKNAHNSQLQRIKTSLDSTKYQSSRSPRSPLFRDNRSPKAQTVPVHSEVAELKARVTDLENALEEAGREMEEVMKRTKQAQIDVMELWNEREEAVRTTKKLELEVAAERKRGLMGRMRTLQS